MSLSEKKLSLLVVDDHKMVAGAIASNFDNSNLYKKVSVVYNGNAAIDSMKEYQYDIVFMDYSMPGMRGDDASRKILEQFPDTKIIALSMFNDQHIVNDMMEAGCVSYLLKESPLLVLNETIKRVWAGEKYFDANLTAKIFSKEAKEENDFWEKVKGLIDDEKNILILCTQSKTNEEIGIEINKGKRTVEGLIVKLEHLFGVKGKTGLAFVAAQAGLVQLRDIVFGRAK
ncbi:DNA-binding response regulator [Bacteroidota bacterium]|nr:DNA-binding response regulator [Bacteroidota bacterium]